VEISNVDANVEVNSTFVCARQKFNTIMVSSQVEFASIDGMSDALHIPVLRDKIIELLTPSFEGKEEALYFDGTFGRGGHLRSILNHFPQVKAVAVDRDPEAVEYGRSQFTNEIASGRLILEHANFAEFSPELAAQKWGLFDGMLVDLGVSSPQLDQGHRGFSFYHEGPLDMRMDNTQGPTAADIIATYDEEDLIQVFQKLGEVGRPFRVVRAIVNDRQSKPFTTTRELASLIERVEGWHRKGFHPATQYFMALRLQVNQELEGVQQALVPLIHGLKTSGRLAVLTFHSLEDRIVKNVFKEQVELGAPVFKKVIQPEWSEQKTNSRARSAKLRIFEKGKKIVKNKYEQDDFE
jgi:16S rRNA (cytosine1402-N4)-methyltransferase